MKHYFEALRRSVDFSGSLSRSGYWTFLLFNLLLFALALLCDNLAGLQFSYGRGAAAGTAPGGWITAAYALLTLPALLAATVRRLHDTARSAAWILLAFVPVIGQIVLLVYLCQPHATEADYENRGFAKAEVDEEFDPEAHFGKEYWKAEEEDVEEGGEGEPLSVENHVPGKIF